MKFAILFLLFLFCIACETSNTVSNYTLNDTPSKGTINISVDESFKPVIEEQLKVYQSIYPNTTIVAHYKSEFDCFKDLQNDSARLIITSRGLNKNEELFYKSKIEFIPQYSQLAFDAVAAIININNIDSVFSFANLQEMVSGRSNYTVVVDGNNATSTVKYLQDSILKGASLGKNVVAVAGSNQVIETIKKTKNAIGFVGNSWVSDGYNSNQINNFNFIKLALIECVRCPEKGYYAKASQATLTFGQYPLARPLYYIAKENWLGLATGFANFMASEKGQLIFRRSCLVPAKMNFNKRNSSIKN
jgi:phosphate transport system substrate-binding protein